MNNSLLLALAGTFAFAVSLHAQSRQLVKKWESDATLKTPESVLFDPAGRVLYVSNIDGKEPWTKDGAGSIGKVGLDGKVIAAEWVKGLEAPKGMALHKGKVFRLGHLGDFNDLTLMGTLAGVEMGLAISGVPHRKGGVQAALECGPFLGLHRVEFRKVSPCLQVGGDDSDKE